LHWWVVGGWVVVVVMVMVVYEDYEGSGALRKKKVFGQ